MRRAAWGVLAATLLAALVRFATLTHQALWMDEYIWTLTANLRSLGEILKRPDGYPPTVALLVRALIGAGLGSDFWLRVPSALTGTLSVPLLYLIGRRLASARTALAAAFVLALQPLAVWYSQEVGAYALAMFFALASTDSLLRLLDEGRLRWGMVYALCAAAGFGVHYYFAFIVFGQGVYALSEMVRRPERRRVLLATALAAAVALAPWAPLFLDDVRAQREHDRGSAASLFALPYTAQLFAGGFGIGPPLRSMHAAVRAGETPSHLGVRDLIPPGIGILLVTALGLLGLGWSWNGRRALLLALAILPFVGPWLNSFAGVGYRPRYALSALPFALLLCCGGLETRRRRTTARLLVLLVFVEGAGLVLAVTPEHVREDTRAAARWVAAAGGGDVILVGEGAEPFKRYGESVGRVVDLDLPDTRDPDRLGARLAPILDGDSMVFLVSSRSWTEDPDDRVLELLNARLRLAATGELAGVTVRRFRRLPD